MNYKKNEMTSPIIIKEATRETIPVISVILPVYNGGAYLKQSLESVLNQDLPDFELIIIDDFSTDETLKYLQSIDDPRITIFKNKQNWGLYYNLNFLIGKTKSQLIKLWSHDDIMYPNCLSSFVDFFKKYPDLGFSYCNTEMMDEKGITKVNTWIDTTPEIISSELHAKIAYYSGSIAGNIANVCINKKILEEVGLFNTNMKNSADFEMWVKLAVNHETGFIREKLVRLRDHANQLSRRKNQFVYHVIEDLQVYRYLDSCVTDEIRKEGHKVMRKSKMLFYYTLMLKSIKSGNLKGAMIYLKLISSYENFFLVTSNFIKAKVLNKKYDPKILIRQKD